MSESQTQSYKPASSGAKRVSPVFLWILLLVVAGGAFVAAFYWAGGISGVQSMLGLGSAQQSAQPASSAGAKASSVPSLPADAQALMYTQQLQSQPYIGQLGDGEITAMSVGTSAVSGDSAVVPVTVARKTQRLAKGTLLLKRYNGTWYFTGIKVNDDETMPTPSPSTVDASVVQVITQQQAQAPTQAVIRDGLLGGGHTKYTVNGVVNGAGTKTINVSMSGGSAPAENGRLVLIQKTDGADTYWFVARFEKQ